MGGGVGEAMLIGAAMGGGSAAMTGGDPLKGALFGAAGGGLGAGVAGAQAGGSIWCIRGCEWRGSRRCFGCGRQCNSVAKCASTSTYGTFKSHIFSRTSNWTSWNTGGIQPHVP
jgi:hypothetical protein